MSALNGSAILSASGGFSGSDPTTKRRCHLPFDRKRMFRGGFKIVVSL
jgi:hypothetical protein